MTLLEKQKVFMKLLAQFLIELYSRGYEVTGGELWRSSETAAIYAEEKKGIPNSLHIMRLAIDLNLFRNGVLCTDSGDYADAGGVWKAYSCDSFECCWGGDFSKPDGNHFSIANNGVK